MTFDLNASIQRRLRMELVVDQSRFRGEQSSVLHSAGVLTSKQAIRELVSTPKISIGYPLIVGSEELTCQGREAPGRNRGWLSSPS